MAISTTYSVRQLERSSEDDVVAVVHWEVHKSDQGASVKVYGTVSIEYKDPESVDFIEYENITEQNAIDWFKSALGDSLSEIESRLEAELNMKLNPTSLSGVPW